YTDISKVAAESGFHFSADVWIQRAAGRVQDTRDIHLQAIATGPQAIFIRLYHLAHRTVPGGALQGQHVGLRAGGSWPARPLLRTVVCLPGRSVL
ncbi:MAG: hypothetical protein JXM73_16685, partial [Anaerolineae bacterium]|nr:hypothetical protein [Anaerolineae bacterium]